MCVDNGFLLIISSDRLSFFCHKKSYVYTEAYYYYHPKPAQTFLPSFIIDLNRGAECKYLDMSRLTDYGRPVRKSLSLHGRKSTHTPKFSGTSEAYFVCHISPNFQISLTYVFIGCPYKSKEICIKIPNFHNCPL